MHSYVFYGAMQSSVLNIIQIRHKSFNMAHLSTSEQVMHISNINMVMS